MVGKEDAREAILTRIVELAPVSDPLQLRLLAEAFAEVGQVRGATRDSRATFVG